ncbi:hypothetical protein BDR22DRAFT_826617 [Usnea florida]
MIPGFAKALRTKKNVSESTEGNLTALVFGVRGQKQGRQLSQKRLATDLAWASVEQWMGGVNTYWQDYQSALATDNTGGSQKRMILDVELISSLHDSEDEVHEHAETMLLPVKSMEVKRDIASRLTQRSEEMLGLSYDRRSHVGDWASLTGVKSLKQGSNEVLLVLRRAYGVLPERY